MMSKVDTSKNDWFKNEDKDEKYETNQHINANNMGQMFRTFKKNNQEMVVHKDVQELHHSSGNSLYDDDDTQYCGSDIFGKLKFDDLRKVHKDETIFAVKESDINKKNIHNSVESLQRERGVGLTPMQKENAERMLRENQQLYKNHILEKQHTSNLQTNQYQEKNKRKFSLKGFRIAR